MIKMLGTIQSEAGANLQHKYLLHCAWQFASSGPVGTVVRVGGVNSPAYNARNESLRKETLGCNDASL